ncbi:PF20097 family protein [uncultured Adlercreutzia sp.]|nr:PF20097 family protein [uncultured Adlercreutzia sp.]
MQTCYQCGNELEPGYLFSTKDGALSFADEVPSSFENARHAPGFVELTAPKIGGRTTLAADICRKCRRIVIDY